MKIFGNVLQSDKKISVFFKYFNFRYRDYSCPVNKQNINFLKSF